MIRDILVSKVKHWRRWYSSTPTEAHRQSKCMLWRSERSLGTWFNYSLQTMIVANLQEWWHGINVKDWVTLQQFRLWTTMTEGNIETSYFTQLKMCCLMTTFRCPSDILITSWLFTARRSTWPGNHLVPCVAELVGSCIPIHAHRCMSSWSKVPLLSIWSVAVPLCWPLLPCLSRWHGSLPRRGLWWLTWSRRDQDVRRTSKLCH